jgi:hypothetical protein
VGFIYQFFNLTPTLTVAENMRLPLELNGWDEPRIAARTRALRDLVLGGLPGRAAPVSEDSVHHRGELMTPRGLDPLAESPFQRGAGALRGLTPKQPGLRRLCSILRAGTGAMDRSAALWSCSSAQSLLSYHFLDAGWSSLAARRAHNPKVVGSNPTPATI